jgi:hypothetical protein
MFSRKAVALVALFACLPCICQCQATSPVQPLSLSTPLRTEAPFRTLFGRRLCDSSGAIYIRYFPSKGTEPFAAPITKIEKTGNIKEIPIGKLPGLDSQLAAFAVGSGKLFEVLVAGEHGSPDRNSYYAVFDHNGSLVSKNRIDVRGIFFPTTLAPFPNGDFFASGTQIISGEDKASSSNNLVAAIFTSDALLKHVLGKASEKDSDFVTRTDELVNGEAFVAEDQRLYVFHAASPVKVEVFDPMAKLEKTLKLSSPLRKATPTAMFFSSGRALIDWTPETDNAEDRAKLALYDIQSGSLLRVYDTNFKGSPVCFEDGKTLRILTVMESGFFGLATAELQ